MSIDIALGRMTTNYGVIEATAGTPVVPTGASFIENRSGFDFAQGQNSALRDDFVSTSGSSGPTVLTDKSPTWSSASYSLAGALTIVNNDPLLQTAFTKGTTANDVISASPVPSTTQFKVDGAAITAAGECALVHPTGGEKQYAWVTDVTAGLITVYPPLTVAPTAGDNAYGTDVWSTARENSVTATLYSSDNLTGTMAPGSFISTIDFNFAKGELVDIAMTGGSKELIQSIHTTLSAEIDDAVTTVPVTDAGNDVGAILSCESELMLVTAISSLDLTVTRGYNSTTPATHLISVAIGPYEPVAVTSGSPIPGVAGGAWINSTLMKTDVTTISMDMKNLGNMAFGSETYCSKESPERREISISPTLQVDRAAMAKFPDLGSPVPFAIQAGETQGTSCGIYAPAVKFDKPDTTREAGAILTVALQSTSVSDGLTSNSDIYIAFARG
jgi:hypothetical protein